MTTSPATAGGALGASAHRLDQSLGRSDAEVVLADSFRSHGLLRRAGEAKKNLGVADGKITGAEPDADLIGQREKPDGVGDDGTALPDLLRDVFLAS